MCIRPIKSEADYRAALEEIDRLFDAAPGTEEADRLEVLLILVGFYEEEHHRVPLPDPIEAIEYHMERRGLSRADLEPYIGTRGRVSEILNKKRRLSLNMMRRLQAGLGIPAEVLIQPYDLASDALEPDKDAMTSPASQTLYDMPRVEEKNDWEKVADAPLWTEFAPEDTEETAVESED